MTTDSTRGRGAIIIKGLFVRRLPPLSASLTPSGHLVTVSLRGSLRGANCIAFGAVLFISGVALFQIGFGPTTPAPTELWASLTTIGLLACIVGTREARFSKSCVFDMATHIVEYRVRSVWRNTARQLDYHSLSIRRHRVGLARSGSWLPAWTGHATCLWHNEEMLMVLSLAKDLETCNELSRQFSEVCGDIVEGQGEQLFSAMV